MKVLEWQVLIIISGGEGTERPEKTEGWNCVLKEGAGQQRKRKKVGSGVGRRWSMEDRKEARSTGLWSRKRARMEVSIGRLACQACERWVDEGYKWWRLLAVRWIRNNESNSMSKRCVDFNTCGDVVWRNRTTTEVRGEIVGWRHWLRRRLSESDWAW